MRVKSISKVLGVLERGPLDVPGIIQATGMSDAAVTHAIAAHRYYKPETEPRKVRISGVSFSSRGRAVLTIWYALGAEPDYIPRDETEKRLIERREASFQSRTGPRQRVEPPAPNLGAEEDAAIAKYAPDLIRLRGNPFAAVAVQWGAM